MNVQISLLICIFFPFVISGYYPYPHNYLKKCNSLAYNACERWCYKEYWYGKIALTCCSYREKYGECPRGCLFENTKKWDLRDLYCTVDKNCPHSFKCCSDDCYPFHRICKPIFNKKYYADNDCSNQTTLASTSSIPTTNISIEDTTTEIIDLPPPASYPKTTTIKEISPTEDLIKEELITTAAPKTKSTTIFDDEDLDYGSGSASGSGDGENKETSSDKTTDEIGSGNIDEDLKEGGDKDDIPKETDKENNKDDNKPDEGAKETEENNKITENPNSKISTDDFQFEEKDLNKEGGNRGDYYENYDEGEEQPIFARQLDLI